MNKPTNTDIEWLCNTIGWDPSQEPIEFAGVFLEIRDLNLEIARLQKENQELLYDLQRERADHRQTVNFISKNLRKLNET